MEYPSIQIMLKHQEFISIYSTSILEFLFKATDILDSQRYHNTNSFDHIELLTIHNYDNTIAERKNERSMSELQLIGFKEQHLHLMQDYLNALQMILAMSKNSKCLEKHVATIVADWPGQLFIRKALTHYQNHKFQKKLIYLYQC